MSNLTSDQLVELTARINARLAEFGRIATYMPDLSRGVVRIAFDVIGEWMARTDYLGEDGEPGAWPAKTDAAQSDPMMDGYHVGYQYGYAEAKRVMSPARDEADDKRLVTMSAPAVTPVTDEPEGDPPPLNHAVPDLDAAGKAAKAAIEAVGARMASTSPAAPPKPYPAGSRKSTVGEPAALSHSAAAILGPEHTMVTPLPNAPAVPRQPTREVKPTPDPRVPDPDVAREKLAQALAAGSNGNMAAAISQQRTLEEADADAAARAQELNAVVAALQAMAVDGEMPTVARWENERVGDLPSWKTLSLRHGLTWTDAARQAGLRYTRQGSVEPAVKAAQIQAAERKDARLVSYEMLCAEIRRIAMGKAMPTQAQFDAAKPAVWPTGNALVMRLGTSWADLADILGLDLQRGRGIKK